MRLLLIADIHSNLEALQEVLKEKHDQLICLGDIVGYGPNPRECIELIKENADACLMGNHDAAVCGKIGTAWFNPEAAKAIEWTKRELTKGQTGFLKALPESYPTKDFFCVHGSPANPLFEYILTREQAEEALSQIGQKLLFCAHAHRPLSFFVRMKKKINLKNKKAVISIPSVGQPRDGNPKAGYAVLETETMQLEIKRVDYFVSETVKKIRSTELPRFEADRLLSGI